MTAAELRIGNYLYYEHTTHIVSGVHGNKVYSWWVKDGQPVIEYEAKDISGTQVENPYIDVISQYEPIPLTEEWLEKFGFEKNENGLYKLFNQSEVPILLNGDLNGWTCDGINFSINNTQYVHQLQNLYFALTNEELKLK